MSSREGEPGQTRDGISLTKYRQSKLEYNLVTIWQSDCSQLVSVVCYFMKLHGGVVLPVSLTA